MRNCVNALQSITQRNWHRIILSMIFSLFFLGLNVSAPIVSADDLPPVLDFSTYLGGNKLDYAHDIVLDLQGNVYVTGLTTSPNFPASNPLNTVTPNGEYLNSIIYVTKFDPTGQTILYSTYLGQGVGAGITVDSAGNAYITGQTNGSIALKNPIQSTLKGSWDTFISKLNPSGDALIFSTYLGGNGADNARTIALDANRNIYISGSTQSSDFPTHNAFQPLYAGNNDSFLVKLNASGNALSYSTYWGGSNADAVEALAVSDHGEVYSAGFTISDDFPVLNAFQAQIAPSDCTMCQDQDGFVTKFDRFGMPVYSTYLGGDGDLEAAIGIAIDGHGSAYVVGETSSNNFPIKNPYQANLQSSIASDAFATKFSPDGTQLSYSTYLGGTTNDSGAVAIVVDEDGRAYVGGRTYATDFPVVNSIQSTQMGIFGNSDAFIAQFNPSGQSILFSTYLGGSEGEVASGMLDLALSHTGNLVIAGTTFSDDFPVHFAYQELPGGGTNPVFPNEDAFVTKISFAPILDPVRGPEPHFYTTQTPTLTWTPITYTTQYHIQVSLDQSFTMPLEFEMIVEVSDLDFPHYPQVVIDPVMNGRHYWRIQALRPNGSWTIWSPMSSFTVRASS